MTNEGWLYWSLGILATYLLGGVPFGLLIGLAKGVDIRQHGSKNIGSANAGRTLGRKFGVLTFVLDFAKGFGPVLISGFVMGTIARQDIEPGRACLWLAFGVAAFIGHLVSPWLKFKGGKGVATGFGVVVGVFPMLTLPALAAILTWLVGVRLTRYIGLSSCLAAVSLPVFLLVLVPVSRAIGLFVPRERMPGAALADVPVWNLWPFAVLALLIAVSVVWRHRPNIARMLDGTEPKVKTKKERQAAAAAAALLR